MMERIKLGFEEKEKNELKRMVRYGLKKVIYTIYISPCSIYYSIYTPLYYMLYKPECQDSFYP